MANEATATGGSTAIAGMGWMAAAGIFIETMGLREQGRLARIQGERQQMAAEFNAWQAEKAAGVTLAISQRQAIEERRQADLEASRSLAVAAASGGGVSDPTIVRLLARTQGEGVYRANVALYEGEARARQLRFDAMLGKASGFDALAEGAGKEQAYALYGLGNLARGGASLYAKYGMGGPGTLPAGTPRTGSGGAALIDE